jgi:CsoR family transcriptional regulator, copper-sensing transcriptional repressor
MPSETAHETTDKPARDPAGKRAAGKRASGKRADESAGKAVTARRKSQDERGKLRLERKDRRTDRAHRIERRLALPVIIAAVVSVPATFLSAVDGWPGQLGKVINWGTAAVLAGEPVLLFLLTGHRLAWLREHLWAILIAAVAVPAALFAAVAPYFQALRVLRLAHLMTALRLLRINRILKAADTLRRYLLVDIFWRRLSSAAGPLVAFGFAGLVLADHQYRALLYLDELSDRFGPVPVVLVVALLAVALAVTVRELQKVLSAWIRGLVARMRGQAGGRRPQVSTTRRREDPGSSATAG